MVHETARMIHWPEVIDIICPDGLNLWGIRKQFSEGL